MRILLDECLPRKLKNALPDFDVSTVPEMGWSGLKNGVLLARASKQFDVFITIDSNLQFQQNLENAGVAVLVMKSASNSLAALLVLVPHIQAALQNIQTGTVVYVGQQ